MRLCEENNWIFPSSEIIDLELSKITNNEKFLKITHLYEKTNDHLRVTDKTMELSKLYREQGIRFYDSMHLALAEENGYHYLFTTDDGFIKLSKKLFLNTKVMNPIEFILEGFESE
jgi:predicted nucleic acid-binding protein